MTTSSVNITELIDQRPLTRFQIGVIALCATVAFLDGFDTQAIAYAAPGIAGHLRLPMTQFGPVFSVGLAGAFLGALTFGPLADRYGRKWLLIVATFIFGVGTLLTARADTLQGLVFSRVIAGFGLGGATPNFIALAAEYAPAGLRATLVTLLYSAFPLGGMIGGFTSSYVIPKFGWPALFYVGAVLPVAVAILLAALLPESLRFLLLRGSKPDEARRIVERLAPGAAGPGSSILAEVESSPGKGFRLRRLFTEGRAVPTLLLWVPFFASFMILSSVVLWTPSLLNAARVPIATSAVVVAFYNFGSVIGNATFGWLMSRMGGYKGLAAALAVGGISLGSLGYVTFSLSLMALSTILGGFFIGGASAGLLALAAMMYPTAIRSTGVGSAMSMGRAGQILGPLAGGAMLASHWEMSSAFIAAGIPCLIGAVAVGALGLRRGAPIVVRS